MALTISDYMITSDCTNIYAQFHLGAWVIHSPRLLDRNQAITAMTIAEERAKTEPNEALIAVLERELL